MPTKTSPERDGVRLTADALTPTPIAIREPNLPEVPIWVQGTSPYMQQAFGQKQRQQMIDKMKAGTTARSRKSREARDFDADYDASQHKSAEGWYGIPAAAFRAVAIDACRGTAYVMVAAKMALHVVADGYDARDATPLVRLIGPEPERTEMALPNANGAADIRVRPMWREWGARVTVRFDADQFTASDVVNLLWRGGALIGVGEGRPGSKKSYGMGFGLFQVVNEPATVALFAPTLREQEEQR